MKAPLEQPVSQADMLAAFDQMAAQQPALLAQRLAEEGLPDTVSAQARSDLDLALAGVRRALAGWQPRPPLNTADTAEVNKLFAIVEDMVAVELAAVLTARLEPFAKTAMRTRSALSTWSAKRRSAQVKPTEADIAAMSDTDPVDFDTMEREELPDGSFRMRYRVKPDKADLIDWTSRGLAAKDKGE